jgi:phosphate transport system permease protein
MTPLHLLIVLLLLSAAGYYVGRKKAFGVAGGSHGLRKLHSRPVYYGALTALWCGIPAIAVVCRLAGFRTVDRHRFGAQRPPG